MSDTWFDLAPPATWQRFEELCADTFEAVFRDPALVRYGRSGQAQSGVDIVASDGAIWPIGLQCKQKRRWPVKKLTIADVDKEVAKALKYPMALQSFYILTTAESDTAVTDHAAKLTVDHAKKKVFSVHVLGWQEICRRATLHEGVARKHFGLFGGVVPQPLLATWIAKGGRLVVDDDELALSIRELQHDLREFPGGRIVIRQRESDQLRADVQAIAVDGASRKRRLERVALRDRLATLEEGERWVETGARLFLTDRDIEYYPRLLHPKHSATMVRSFIERCLSSNLPDEDGDRRLKLCSPKDPNEDVSVGLSLEEVNEILEITKWRRAKFGREVTDTLGELPDGVRSKKAIPAVLDRIVRLIHEGATAEQLRSRGLLELASWKINRLF